jgi:Flp pilus assembly protein TadG
MKSMFALLRGKRFRTGQGMVEFAMAASVFLMLTFAIIELAMVVYSYNSISHAARECVRYVIVHSPTGPNPSTTSQIQNVTVLYAHLPTPNQLEPADITITFPADPNLPTQKDAQCSVSLNYTLRLPFLPSKTLPLTATARMLVSQ